MKSRHHWLMSLSLAVSTAVVGPGCGKESLEGVAAALASATGSPEAKKRAEADRAKAAIERALVLDQGTTVDSGSTGEVVRRMRRIDTSDCPNEFRAAYLAHIHAWEMLEEVEAEAARHRDESGSGATLVESFIRGMLGDPFGKANEIRSAQTALESRAQEASREMKRTYQRIKEVAAMHGADPEQRAEVRSIQGLWHFAGVFNGRLVTGLYEFGPEGVIIEHGARGDRTSSSRASWSRDGDSVAIRWQSGSLETADARLLDDGRLSYRITGHTGDPSQVGHDFTMTRVPDPSRTMGVVTITNRLPNDVVFRTRWATFEGERSHSFNQWTDSRIPVGKAFDFYCPTGYLVQVRYDRSYEPGTQETAMDLPVSVVPRADRPGPTAGRRYSFQPVGASGLELVAGD